MESIEIKNAKDCCGCKSCANVCPKQAISFEINKEGFEYPNVDKNKCINCGLCRKVCPLLNEVYRKNYFDIPKCYAAKSKEIDVQLLSSSGGVFGIFAKKILKNNGIVVGCTLDDNKEAKHIVVKNIDDLKKIMGSKYVISNTNDVFKKVKNELESKREVLFCGTPCQVSALILFLRKDYQNLHTAEVICHGVPSQKLLTKYIDYLEKKYDSKLLSFDFRSKKAARWGTYKAFVKFLSNKNNKIFYKKINADFDPYYWSFLNMKNYRESCYECKFAQKKRNADFTLGDFWGIEKLMPSMVDYNGVSILIVNNEKGLDFIQDLEDKIILKEVEYSKICEFNGQLKEPPIRPKERENWYKNIDDADFIENITIKPNLRSYIKIFFPQSLKFKIKKFLKKR